MDDPIAQDETSLGQAFRLNGWEHSDYDERTGMDIYTNSGWPECRILCGGGWSVQGESLHAFLANRTDLGSGSDYGKLAQFVIEVGSAAKPV